MAKMKWMLAVGAIMVMAAASLLPVSAHAEKVLYIGGTQSLTGPFAEDSAAVLLAIQDYANYVNKTKKLAPWRKETWPADVKLEVMWRDDELKPPKALSIYEELKAKGMLVARISGSPIALALKDRLWADHMGATSMATGPYYLSPPQSCFTYYPIYTDSIAAIADWFKASWKEARKPKVAYLTADNAMGRSIEIPEMKAYLEKIGYEFVGTQYVPLVPTSPPTTQLTWLKEKGVDLALGVMINAGAQPTVKEMVRLGMGPNQPYKMTFGVPAPGHSAVFAEAMGELGIVEDAALVAVDGEITWIGPNDEVEWAGAAVVDGHFKLRGPVDVEMGHGDADQRHRLAQVRPSDQGGRLRAGARRPSRCGPL